MRTSQALARRARWNAQIRKIRTGHAKSAWPALLFPVTPQSASWRADGISVGAACSASTESEIVPNPPSCPCPAAAASHTRTGLSPAGSDQLILKHPQCLDGPVGGALVDMFRDQAAWSSLSRQTAQCGQVAQGLYRCRLPLRDTTLSGTGPITCRSCSEGKPEILGRVAVGTLPMPTRRGATGGGEFLRSSPLSVTSTFASR